MGSILAVDYIFRDLDEKRRSWIYLLFITALVIPSEIFLINAGFREYTAEVLKTTSGFLIPSTKIPVELFLVVPIFNSLIITFYKYLNYIWDKK